MAINYGPPSTLQYPVSRVFEETLEEEICISNYLISFYFILFTYFASVMLLLVKMFHLPL